MFKSQRFMLSSTLVNLPQGVQWAVYCKAHSFPPLRPQLSRCFATAWYGRQNRALEPPLKMSEKRAHPHYALSWTKAHALGVTEDPLPNNREVHVHIPEGSICKEGPSAGTALLSAFVSSFTKTPISLDIAMSSENSCWAGPPILLREHQDDPRACGPRRIVQTSRRTC
jgi:hypothetical protein